MINRLVALCSLAVTLVAVAPANAGPASCKAAGAVRLTAGDSGRVITVRCGQSIVVSLQSVPGKASRSSNPESVKAGPITQGTLIAGQDEFRFVAVSPGRASVTVSRLLPAALPGGLSSTTGLQWTAQVRVIR